MMALSPLIEAIELNTLLNSDLSPGMPLKIIDVRFDLGNPSYGDDEYRKGHIPGALRLDLERDICAPKTGDNGRHPLKSQDALIEVLQEIGINNHDRIVVYDDKSGMFASHAWWVLRHLGHHNVHVLNGGFHHWQAINGDIDTTIATPIRGDITSRESDFNLVSLPETLDYVKGDRHQKMQIVDARGAARFRGEVEPLDPIAGHIPTAINYPFEQNLNSSGTFKDPATLKAQWSEFLKEIDPSTIVHQCGSGVSACHNLFALYYAGFGPTQLYHGSWSEWCADKDRPMITLEALINA